MGIRHCPVERSDTGPKHILYFVAFFDGTSVWTDHSKFLIHRGNFDEIVHELA